MTLSARRPESFRPDAKSVLDTVELIRTWIRFDHAAYGGWDETAGHCTSPDHARLRWVVQQIAPHRITSLPRCARREPSPPTE